MVSKTKEPIPQQIIEDLCEWSIMHGVAFRQSDNTARHCPFSVSPVAIDREVFHKIRTAIPAVSKLISHLSEDHAFLQSSLADLSSADPFFQRLMALHKQNHGTQGQAKSPKRRPLLLMRTDFMDDEALGAKVIEFNGIAAGMAPFGQRASELHQYIRAQWPQTFSDYQGGAEVSAVENDGLHQMALGIAAAANEVKADFYESGKPLFLMVVQKNEDNVYDQHLLELELNRLGVSTVRRTFDQLSQELATGENNRLLLANHGPVDVVYLRAGYQFSDYFAPELDDDVCCQTLSQTRLFIEQHHVAVNATISQQLATSKAMQMLITQMPEEELMRWRLTKAEARQVKSVLAEMKPVTADSAAWFQHHADPNEWVLKNQGEGGGHCIFGDEILTKLNRLKPSEYPAWALMQRLHPKARAHSTVAVRDSEQTVVNDLISEIGLFSVFYRGEPVTELDGYAGYLIRSKPASENEGGIHSGKGILDSLVYVDEQV